MIATPASADTDLRASHRARIERHMAMLEEAAEISRRLVLAAGRRAVEASEAAQAGEAEEAAAVRSFDQAARCMRQTVALEARLSEALIKLEASGPRDLRAEWAAEMAGAAQRLREKLRRLALGDEAFDEDDEDEDEADGGDAVVERWGAGARERLADPGEAEDLELGAQRAAAVERWRGVGSEMPARSVAAAGPLHHALHGPPPAMGEEWAGRPGTRMPGGPHSVRGP